MDKNLVYPAATRLKAEGMLSRGVRVHLCKYLNNIIKQDHRVVKEQAR
jgi:hypothetical protein